MATCWTSDVLNISTLAFLTANMLALNSKHHSAKYSRRHQRHHHRRRKPSPWNRPAVTWPCVLVCRFKLKLWTQPRKPAVDPEKSIILLNVSNSKSLFSENCSVENKPAQSLFRSQKATTYFYLNTGEHENLLTKINLTDATNSIYHERENPDKAETREASVFFTDSLLMIIRIKKILLLLLLL